MSPHARWLMVVAFAGVLTMSCQQVSAQQGINELLKDVSPGGSSSAPLNFTSVGGMLYFSAFTGPHGRELWKSDGTPGGTVMVKDINPGTSSSYPASLLDVGGVLYFQASDDVNGTELWQSDGTADGTVMVKDINPGASSSNPGYITELGGVLFFMANDGTHGYELWKSDGTPTGTWMVKDINPGASYSSPSFFTEAFGVLFFNASDGTNGPELWKTDGTLGGTVMVKDIYAGLGGSYPQYFTDAGGVLYFQATTVANGIELWKSDGTPGGTVLVKDIFPGTTNSTPTYLSDVGGVLFFSAYDPTNGIELWKSDGTPGGTVMVKDINPGTSNSSPADLLDFEGTAYFRANDGTTGLELWKSDGTPGGTVMVSDINPGASGSAPVFMTEVGGKLFFRANDGSAGNELWMSDGTPGGTVMVEDIYPGATGGTPQYLTDVGGVLYFQAGDGTTGIELWRHYHQGQVGKILSVSDIPGDQGGQVHVQWKKSVWDTASGSGHVLSYGIWRKVSPPMAPQKVVGVSPGGYMTNLSDSLSDYFYMMEVPAVGIPTYNVVVPTLNDSSSEGLPYSTFIITAHTADVHYYYTSRPDSGYSVDNLAPIPPAGLLASVLAGPQVELTWHTPTDPDVGHYNVYRSPSAGFTPDEGNKIGTSTSTGYTDTSPIPGAAAYYKIIAVDIHDNPSEPSGEAGAAVTVNRQFNVTGKWNIVSVPLTMSDYTNAILFPTATTNAFTFDDGYVSYGILQNGVGYWMKFSSGEILSHDGLERLEDTIAVQAGWNMVGSLSSPVATSSVSSIPGGIVTSSFYRYENGYSASSVIDPGRGYWVKVNQAGRLIMSTASARPRNRIRIEDTGELPPPPPEDAGPMIPEAYTLRQNYPNPFNPTTTINYTLPGAGHVKVSIFNLLGEQVAVLVDETQEAGFKSVSFRAGTLPSGVYTYRIVAGTFTDTKKMLLLK